MERTRRNKKMECPLVDPQERGAKVISGYGTKEGPFAIERMPDWMMEWVPAMIITGVEW
jgi:hypothetical protein